MSTSSIFKKKWSLYFATVNNIYTEPQKKHSINKSEILLSLKYTYFNSTYRKVISSRFHSTSRVGEVRDNEVRFNQLDLVHHHHESEHTASISHHLVCLLRQAREWCGPILNYILQKYWRQTVLYSRLCLDIEENRAQFH